MKIMKKITLLWVFGFIFLNMLFAREYNSGEGGKIYQHYTAGVIVKDVNGEPLSGIRVTLHALYGLLTFEGPVTEDASVSALTDANGFVYLSVYADVTNYYPSKYVFYNLQIDVTEPGYSVLSHSGDYSEFTYTSSQFTITIDKDGNGVDDNNELILAKKFCPVLRLNSQDGDVRPVPVEIMDRDGDGVLTGDDVFLRLYNSAGNYVADIPAYQVYYPEIVWSQKFPYSDELEKHSCWFDTNGDGNYGYEGDGIAYGTYFMFPHFEFGSLGNTNPGTWYDEFNQKISEHSTDVMYTGGTTYVYFTRNGDEITIQYWFFYPFNAAANRHEGDWERVYVTLNTQVLSQANISKVEYFHHSESTITYPHEIEILDESHPKVYVGGYTLVSQPKNISGHGTHASYPWPGQWDSDYSPAHDNVDGQGIQIDFNNYNSVVIISKYSYIDDGHVNIHPFINSQGYDISWVLFGGLWGHVLSTPSAFAYADNILDLVGVKIGNKAPRGPKQH